MATWIYRCEKCSTTFVIEVEAGNEAPENAPCPECGAAEAGRLFELPTSGGCGCGSGSSCC